MKKTVKSILLLSVFSVAFACCGMEDMSTKEKSADHTKKMVEPCVKQETKQPEAEKSLLDKILDIFR